MAVYFLIQTEQNQHLKDIFMSKRLIDGDNDRVNYEAAIKIQSWFRSIKIRKYIRFMNLCAIKIQRIYRGYAGRIIYRKLVKQKINELAKLYYDQMATVIQARWRGYCVRKYKFDFYARKEYLAALLIKNEAIREQLERTRQEKLSQEETDRCDKELAEKLYNSRKHHYLLSTQVCRGVYNSPTKPRMEKELSLASVSPFSKEERMLIEQAKKVAYLKTATGIPSVAIDNGEVKATTKKVCILPPLKDKVKPQGPFRSPRDVRKQRYKQLQPSLRVATDYESVEKSRIKLREEDWTKQVIDKKFLPSTKNIQTYNPSLHTTTSYGRPDYGTKHFRVTEEQIKPNKAFQRVVSPIPLFDQLGKTY